MPRKQADLFKALLVHEPLNAVARREFAGGMLALNAILAAAHFELFSLCLQLLNLLVDGRGWTLFLLFGFCFHGSHSMAARGSRDVTQFTALNSR